MNPVQRKKVEDEMRKSLLIAMGREGISFFIDVARRAGISDKTVRGLGPRTTYAMFWKIAQVLDCQVSDLMPEEDPSMEDGQ